MIDPLGALVGAVAACGLSGLALLAFAERLVPILPSHALLVAVGVVVAQGQWSLPMALLVSVAAGLLGCLPFYGLGRALGEERSLRLLARGARLLGVSAPRFQRLVEVLRARERSVALGAQMIPTVRLIAPGISGLIRTRFGRFAVATAAGAALWNALFLGVGYVAGQKLDQPNASALALSVVFAVVGGEIVLFGLWRLYRSRQEAAP